MRDDFGAFQLGARSRASDGSLDLQRSAKLTVAWDAGSAFATRVSPERGDGETSLIGGHRHDRALAFGTMNLQLLVGLRQSNTGTFP